MIGDGWRLLESRGVPDLARIIRALVEDPQPLCDALDRYPWTLLHGDPRLANMGLERTGRGRLLLLDWQLASCGPPAIDLAWFIDCATPDLRIEDRDVVIERYRRALARRIGDRFDEGWWQPQLELSLLGQFVRDAWFMLYEAAHGASPEARARAQSDLHWWSDRTREGAAWL
jgi:thiamine kinase-like enzyme